MVNSSKPNPIRPISSNINLTCTVVLNPAVDVPVAVNIVWTGPAGDTISSVDLVMKNITLYTSTATISLFRRSQSGNYTCRANVNSRFLVLSENGSTIMVTVGKIAQ